MQEIQVAIQGGGAKIWALLAAIEGLQELEAENVLRVTRIAGNSAGAIVACIFAGRIPANSVRTILKMQFGEKLVRLFPRPSPLNILRLFLTGKPLWDENALGKVLASLFNEHHLFYFDSSGIPFCFRTWRHTGGCVIVDGGLCENIVQVHAIPR
jgi:predicted acylesterase/phospholipase RssA